MKKGIKIVIIDHHQIERENPYCILVNPQQSDCPYPNKQASGSLLAWKVCQVLDDYFHENYSDGLVDLAGLGLYSDMQDMSIMENRYVISQFFGHIKNLGLKQLLKVLDKDKVKLSTTVIGFDITPCINAATRLDLIEVPLELFTTDDKDRAIELSKQLKENNETRKKVQKEAVTRIKKDLVGVISNEDKVLTIIDNSLGKGYNGLIANDLSKTFKRPTFVLGEDESTISGSFRSYGDLQLLNLLQECEHLTNAGGHEQAGGIKVEKNKFQVFKSEIIKLLDTYKVDDSIYYDIKINADDLNSKIIQSVEDFFNISGTGFEISRFLITDLHVVEKKIIGSSKDTLKLGCLTDTQIIFDEKMPSLYAMKFKTDSEFMDRVNEGDTIDVIGTLNINSWARYKPRYEVVKTNQIMIEDIRIHNKRRI